MSASRRCSHTQPPRKDPRDVIDNTVRNIEGQAAGYVLPPVHDTAIQHATAGDTARERLIVGKAARCEPLPRLPIRAYVAAGAIKDRFAISSFVGRKPSTAPPTTESRSARSRRPSTAARSLVFSRNIIGW